MKRTGNARQKFGGRGLGLAIVLLLGLIGATGLPANAQALLRANDSSTQSLRLKSLDVNVSIRGAFAQTQVQMTFQNELAQRTEADFQYVVPDGSLVTHFAYWFKDEKVTARVVEKERALAIYQSITSQQRDPALIERINKNTFRARIFPIEENADLKVEMRWVQVLSSDAKGMFYQFPLKPQEEGKGTLENLNIQVKATPGANVSKIVNNYKLTPRTEQQAQVFRLSEKNYRPAQDFVMRFERPVRALHASLYAAPSGGRDGFFALALTPSQNLKAPKLTFNGVATYNVLPARLPNLSAHQTFVVVGRYRPVAGNKPVDITLSGYAGANMARQSLTFSNQREDNNLASKLWANAQIEALSPNDKTAGKNRERIIALSTRFTLPSSVTSWLAVPKSEWENFKQQVAWNDIARIGPQLARLSEQGKLQTPTAKRLRAQFNAACKVVGEDPAQRLNDYFADTQRRRRTKLLNNRTHAAQRLAQAIANGEKTKAVNYRREVARLNRRLGENTNGGITEQHNSLMQTIAYQLANAKMQSHPDEKHIHQLEAQWKRLQPHTTLDARELQARTNKNALEGAAQRLAAQITTEITNGRGDGEKTLQLKREASELGTRVGLDGQSAVETQTRLRATERAVKLARQLVEQQYAYQPDQAQIQKLQTQLERLETAGAKQDEVLQTAKIQWSWSSWQQANRWANATHGQNPNPDEAAHWRKTLEESVRINNQYKKEQTYYSSRSAEQFLADAEYNYIAGRVYRLRNQRATENTLKNRDTQSLQRIDDEIKKILDKALPETRQRLTKNDGHASLWGVRDLMLAEYKKEQPNQARTAEIEQKFIAMQTDQYFTRSKINDPRLYGQLRIERLKTRTQRELVEEKLRTEKELLSPEETKRLSTNQARLAAREKELAVRMGDPLIQVQAPQDAQQVVAVFPGGEIKQLVFNTDSQQWEARFDVPTYAVEGAYTVSVIVVFKDGTRKHLTMRFHVDVTAPGGAGKALLIDKDGARLLRLELDADEDTARVQALLPNGRKMELSPSTQEKNRFFALAPLTAKGSQPLEMENLNVVFILTDRAHNRTTITVDMSQ